ncbi:MAG: hypothetical protein HY866_08240 [Chloroflexi bacterium]|nr:hypothetical protein [Chloroflexota bacterium]
MADNQQVKIERTRRSRRSEQEQPQSDGQVFVETREELRQIDEIITGIVAPAATQPSVTLGGGQPQQDVRNISSEEMLRGFRQQSGQ